MASEKKTTTERVVVPPDPGRKQSSVPLHEEPQPGTIHEDGGDRPAINFGPVGPIPTSPTTPTPATPGGSEKKSGGG